MTDSLGLYGLTGADTAVLLTCIACGIWTGKLTIDSITLWESQTWIAVA